ncbi:MAG TPA: hypothetical protein VFH06_02130 [Candidatus Saccharimonadales bacterium]|nr:hypothetical protein [Candidatus Saccharimonadales bacterium]
MDNLVTRGKGMRALQAYFEVLGSTLPSKLPEKTSDWQDGAQYDAPHGFLFVGSNGNWHATFSLRSVAADIQRISGLTVSGGH